MRRLRRWIIPALVVVAVIAAVGWGLRPQPVMVETVTAARGPMRVTIEEEGKTRLKERYVVSAPITGRMERIRVREGDPVRSGAPLTTVAPLPAAFLDPRTQAQGRAEINVAEARITAANERVRAAQAQASLADSEMKRVAALYESGDIPRARYDQAVAQQQQAAATLAEAQAALAAARAEMTRAQAALEQPAGPRVQAGSRVSVSAPVGGRVLRLIRESEGPVNAGEPLLEIGDARALEVEIELLSHDAVKVGPGTRVLFHRWGGDLPLEGMVQFIEPTGRTKISALGVEEQRVPVIAVITSSETEWQGLGAGYRVEASFILWEGEDVLQIPSSSLFRHNGGWAVFVLDGTNARRRPVVTGQHAGLQVEIREGLQPDEVVIAHPDSTIEDGTLVQPRQGIGK